MLTKTKFIISINTKLNHLTTTLNKPNITIYKPTNPKLINKYKKNQIIYKTPKNKLSQLTTNTIKQFIKKNTKNTTII